MKTTNNALHMPLLGFGTLIPGAAETINATRNALDAGFRHFDAAERYRNEREVGEALHAECIRAGLMVLPFNPLTLHYPLLMSLLVIKLLF